MTRIAAAEAGPRPAIQVLPAEVVERIAAGEVIERPVSVVRELLDNAIDAGAHVIHVDIRGGGLRTIRVADDGTGIPPDEVELAFRHHATSKIRAARDLLDLASLGFRGEALPSIAAVAELSLHSAVDGAQAGVRLDLRSGRPAGRAFLARLPGTTVTVRNLFANTPARLKFMGSARAESTEISRLVRRYALAHPAIRFVLTLDGHTALRTSGSGLQAAIGEVFGPEIVRSLVTVGPLTVGEVEVSGLVSAPQLTRSTRHHITLLVNGRCIASRSLLAACEIGYRPVLPRGRHPLAVLALTVPRGSIDVNVHPSKQEVRLAGESEIAERLASAVRAALGRTVSLPPALPFALGGTQPALPHTLAERGPHPLPATRDRLRRAQVAGQVHGSLILIEDEAGLYLVDQHRAHERAIYELLQRRHAAGRPGQMLLEPLHIELSPAQVRYLEARLPELAALGFECEWFGGRSFLVRSIPAIPETGNLGAAVEDLLDLAAGEETDWQHRLLTSLACRSATRRGRPLTVEQCRELVELLAETETPAICPHGSPIILHFSDRFLRQQFDW